MIDTHGNSLTQGQGATIPNVTNYPGQLQTLFDAEVGPQRTIVNSGFGGRTSAQLVAEFNSVVEPELLSWYTQRIVVMFEVRNSFIAGVSAAQIIAEHQQYAALVAATGAKFVICTAPGSDGTPAGVGIPGEVNAWIRANWQSIADRFVDLEALPEFSPSGDILNPTYYVDGVHLTDAGYGVVAAAVKIAVDSLL